MSLVPDFEHPARTVTIVIKTTELHHSLTDGEWADRLLKIRG